MKVNNIIYGYYRLVFMNLLNKLLIWINLNNSYNNSNKNNKENIKRDDIVLEFVYLCIIYR